MPSNADYVRVIRPILAEIGKRMEASLGASEACVNEMGSAYYDGRFVALRYMKEWIEAEFPLPHNGSSGAS